MRPELLAFQRGFAEAIGRPVSGPLAVYRNTVILGAVEALRANFPVVEQILGSEMFDPVAADHAEACPPRSPVLALYGGRFAGWIGEQGWSADLPYLADVARLERLRVECLFAADAEPAATDILTATGDWDRLRLRLHPAARFAWLASPAMTVWLAHQQPFDGELELDWAAEGALFTRPTRFAVQALRLDPAGHRLLSGIRLGETLGHSARAAARLYPETDFTSLLASLVDQGAFAAPATEGT